MTSNGRAGSSPAPSTQKTPLTTGVFLFLEIHFSDFSPTFQKVLMLLTYAKGSKIKFQNNDLKSFCDLVDGKNN